MMECFELEQHSVHVAISMLDQCAVKQGSDLLQDTVKFQLAALACLYIAVKANETCPLSSQTMSDICHGVFSADEVEKSELETLMTLDWRIMSLPTASCFAEVFLKLMPQKLQKQMKPLVQCQLENAMSDNSLSTSLFIERGSDLALIVLCNAALLVGGTSFARMTHRKIRKITSSILLPYPLGNHLLSVARKQFTEDSNDHDEPLCKQGTSSPMSPRCIARPGHIVLTATTTRTPGRN